MNTPQKKSGRKIGPLNFIGGLACIDFCNTVDHLHSPPAYDVLTGYESVLEWGKAAGIISKAERSQAASKRRPLADLLAVRALVFKLLWPISCGKDPARSDLDAFNARWQKVSSELRITAAEDRYLLVDSSDDPLKRIQTAVVRSLADFLISGRLERVHRCGGCGWIFYDTSRNGLRRWCVMKICGNRTKARRHYQRIRKPKTDVSKKLSR
jgi:predicted RNA-binding Zn ribbon-like protein